MSRAARRPTPTDVGLAGRRLAAIAAHLLERQAADLPPARQNELDRLVAKAVARAGLPRAELVSAARRFRRLPAARRAELFDVPTLDLAPDVAIDLDRIRDIVDQLGPIELPDPGEARPHEVVFSHLICDQQASLVGSDEPYIVFGVVVPGQLGLPAEVRTVMTPIYTEVDPGERRPETASQELRLFGATGPALIDPDQPLVITATAFEHAPGQSAQNVAFAIAGALVIASAVLAPSTPPAAAAFLIAGMLTGLIAGLAFSERQLGDPVSIVMSAADAADLTASTPQVTLPELPFRGYRAVLELRRR